MRAFLICRKGMHVFQGFTYNIGNGDYFTLVDTPGFGDSDGKAGEAKLLEEMIEVLKNELRQTSTLFILLKGTKTRFDAGFQKTIKLMVAMFGETFWDNVVIGKVIIQSCSYQLA